MEAPDERAPHPHRHRRRRRRLCRRGPAQRGPGQPRPPARSGRPRLEPAHPHAGRVHEADRAERELGLRDRPPAGAEQPPDALPAGPHPRRQHVDQRDDLHPGQPARLRRVARPRQRGLGLRRRPAVLPQVREQRAARRRVPRHRRADERHRAGRPQPDLEGLRPGGPERRHPVQPRLQRRRAGRRRLLRRHPAQRPAGELGDRVPRTGAQAQEPDRSRRTPRRPS